MPATKLISSQFHRYFQKKMEVMRKYFDEINSDLFCPQHLLKFLMRNLQLPLLSHKKIIFRSSLGFKIAPGV